MFWISHRGNLTTTISARENSPEYILEALNADFDVEVDVWLYNNELYLGHDRPIYKTDIKFLLHNRLWCHAKNINALEMMLFFKVHCFYHINDPVTLTSRHYIWTFPDRFLTKQSICVLPEISGQDWRECAGVCSDIISVLRATR